MARGKQIEEKNGFGFLYPKQRPLPLVFHHPVAASNQSCEKSK